MKSLAVLLALASVVFAEPATKIPAAKAPSSTYSVTCPAIKQLGDQFRYFFRITNISGADTTTPITILLLHSQGVNLIEDTFEPSAPIAAGRSQIVFLDSHTGPASVHGDWSITGFRITMKAPDGTPITATGTIPNTITPN